MVTLGLGTYLAGNLLWASIISLVLVGFGFPLVWGILSGRMPRSGGEYIYNSRIIRNRSVGPPRATEEEIAEGA